MSYKPVFSDDARAAWRALDLALQERTLDEIDELANHPERMTIRGTGDSAVHDFITEIGDSVHYVFITIRTDDDDRVVQVETIGHFMRPR